jgi:glycosyltransferase involved in cell wall biosynthesis
MRATADVAVVGQDPSLRGGFRSQAEAFLRAARQLGREPHLFYIAHDRATSVLRRSLAFGPRRSPDGLFSGTSYPAFTPELDALNHLMNGTRMRGRLEEVHSLWVVTTSAHYGYPAAMSGRPYACWVGTGFMEEAEARRGGLPRSRRLALRLNSPVFRRMEREVLHRAALVYATSPASRRGVIEAAELSPERVRVLPVAIDSDRFTPEPDDAWHERLEEPVVIFVGRARDPRKNVGLLVDAFNDVRRRIRGVRLLLVGRPPPPAVMRRLQAGTKVCGEVECVENVVRHASLFVLPSLQEGFGTAVAEALASGVPAVVTPCGGPEHLIRESKGGHVLSGFTAEELADTVVELLNDPARLLEMRRRGRDYVASEHAPTRLAELLAPAFRELDGRA